MMITAKAMMMMTVMTITQPQEGASPHITAGLLIDSEEEDEEEENDDEEAVWDVEDSAKLPITINSYILVGASRVRTLAD